MKAVQLSFAHRKLQSVSRELYLEHGWQMPRGLLQHGFCDPRNFTLEEWQQAKRRKKDPRVLKAMFRDAWAISDSQEVFANALLEKGFALARGNRRGFVAVDHTGEVYSLSRWIGKKPKDLRAQLGDEGQLQTVGDAQSRIANMVASSLDRLREELLAKRQVVQVERTGSIVRVAEDQAEQIKTLEREQKLTLANLANEHASRFRTGLFGLLDKLSGRRKRIAEENRLEHERLRRRHDQERTQLQLTLDRKRSSLEQVKDAEARFEKTHSAIASDIEALRNWPVEDSPHAHENQKRNRNRPTRE